MPSFKKSKQKSLHMQKHTFLQNMNKRNFDMKVCIIQPPYSVDYEKSDEIFNMN